MDRLLRDQVWLRAASLCEYCLMPQSFADAGHEVDHVIAEKHRGATTPENLALACFHCNNHKGPNIAGVDPETGQVIRLYHPRQDRWSEHFIWQGPVLKGITPIGRATVEVLEINLRHRLIHRQALIDEGVFPPSAAGA
ncbi:MAG TPA: HNH endonuclease signature motif containing protein [Pirellulales bacterium]|nr:HNH endonuclease signature motif containing protein [Pirellulales bacterium]